MTEKYYVGPITPYNEGFIDGVQWGRNNPLECPICKGSPCVLKDTPKGRYISGAHIKG